LPPSAYASPGDRPHDLWRWRVCLAVARPRILIACMAHPMARYTWAVQRAALTSTSLPPPYPPLHACYRVIPPSLDVDQHKMVTRR